MSDKSAQTFWHAALVVGVVALALFAVATGSVAQGEIQPVNSGFDPAANGFGFENYINDANTKNLTSEEIRRMFGDKVCASQQGEIGRASCRERV